LAPLPKKIHYEKSVQVRRLRAAVLKTAKANQLERRPVDERGGSGPGIVDGFCLLALWLLRRMSGETRAGDASLLVRHCLADVCETVGFSIRDIRKARM
jgi:predicted NAD-dependent protein-ADP-ribosyltransferase YbiA (DUF1768 family)